MNRGIDLKKAQEFIRDNLSYEQAKDLMKEYGVGFFQRRRILKIFNELKGGDKMFKKKVSEDKQPQQKMIRPPLNRAMEVTKPEETEEEEQAEPEEVEETESNEQEEQKKEMTEEDIIKIIAEDRNGLINHEARIAAIEAALFRAKALG